MNNLHTSLVKMKTFKEQLKKKTHEDGRWNKDGNCH